MPAPKQYNQGQIIGNNIIISKDIERTKQTHKSYWLCKCQNCNKIRSVRSDHLKQQCRSCAAKTRKTNILDDLTNQQYGFWKVISKNTKPNYWNCKCLNCGSEKAVFRGNLTSGNSKSCGCINSWGEQNIIYYLQYYNVDYIKEFTFSDLKTDKGGTPRFDFAIFQQNQLYCLIEYDGRQHFNYDENWKMTSNDFTRLQYIDKLKNEYCQKHNIKLYRFNQNTNIERELLKIINSTKGNK